MIIMHRLLGVLEYIVIKMITQRFHYIFDASNVRTLDKRLIRKMMRDIAVLCKMKIIKGPTTVDGMDYNPGISAFCIIDFSHISIHTFTEPKEACIDIFSCKPFDPEEVKNYLMKKLKVEKNITYFKVEYPK